MYCIKCGHEVDAGSDFCSNCGASVKKENTTNTFAKAFAEVEGKEIARIGLYVFSWILVVGITILLIFCPMVKIKETDELREALFDKIDVKQHQWKGLFAIYRQEIIQDVTLITFISRI
mgnify:CR=1 FL=1